jgi:hypothetical protein
MLGTIVKMLSRIKVKYEKLCEIGQFTLLLLIVGPVIVGGTTREGIQTIHQNLLNQWLHNANSLPTLIAVTRILLQVLSTACIFIQVDDCAISCLAHFVPFSFCKHVFESIASFMMCTHN